MIGFDDDLRITSNWSLSKKLSFTNAELRGAIQGVGEAISKIWKIFTYRKPKYEPMRMWCTACHSKVEVVNELNSPTMACDEYAYCKHCRRLLGKQL